MPKLTVRSRKLTSGIDVFPPSLFSVAGDSSATLSAAAVLPDPANPANPLTFLFWNVAGTPYDVATVPVADVGNADLTASAWYLDNTAKVPLEVDCFAFSLSQDKILAETPIAAVTPAAAWPGGNSGHVSTAAASVNITGKAAVAGPENFVDWRFAGPGSVAGVQLSVPTGQSSIALARYAAPPSGGGGGGGGGGEASPQRIFEVLDELRVRLKDFISDPAPVDLARAAVALQVASMTAARPETDELTGIMSRAGQLKEDELKLLRAELQARGSRMEAALHAVDAALRRPTKT